MKRKFFAVILFGLFSHLLYHPTERGFGERWGLIVRYGIGSLGVIASGIFISDDTNKNINVSEQRFRDRYTVVSLVATFLYGIGVISGHVLERLIFGIRNTKVQ